MEFYGSLHNISGSVTASAFSGSFKGDGGGLYNLPASGVTGLNLSQIASGDATASISSSGFTVNKSTQIQGDLSVTGSIIATNYIVSSSVTYMTTSFASGSSMFGNDDNDVHQFTGSVQITGSISLNGQAIGTGKLDETTFQSYTSSNNSRVSALETSSGSLNSFTSSIDTTIKSKLNTENVISGSIQVDISGTTNYSTFSSSLTSSIGFLSSSIATTTSGLSSSIGSLSSSVATTTLNTKNRVDSIENKTGSYATTGSNLFKGTQTHSGSILPSVDNAYDLGSAEYQWRDVYISSGSLYIDGTKVISSTAQELTITTDTGQSLKILEGTTDSIILQTADGDIELKSSADGDILLDPTNGKIMLKGPVEILNGQKIQSSVGGTPVVFANDIVISGSIDITGTIEGINLTDFSSSVNTRIGNLESAGGNLNTFTASAINRLSAIETSTGSLNNFTSSINTTIKSKLNVDGVISGSSQVILTGTTGYSTFSSSVATSVNDLSSSMNSLSSSFSSTDTSHNTRLTTIEGRYVTTGSNIFKGDQTITGSLYISQNLIVQGSSSLENITASAVSIGTNKIILNSNTPAIRYAGISVFDSGSTNVTASLFYDSLTNNWKFQHSDVGTDDASILLYGPLGTGIDNAPTLVGNFLTKVEDNGHGHHLTTSSIFDNGSKISLKNNTEITGSVIITSTIVSQGTTLVSGSSQISYTGLSNIPTGIVSGSSQVISLLPAGTVSGSSQILNGTTIHSGSFFNGISVVSGSAQISFNGITDKPALVSGSSQITFGSISSIPGGLVSGSSQIDLTSTTNYASGILTRLNAVGVFSGSAQVTGISNAQLTNSSFHVGTTSISLGRGSASQTLTGVSVDGTAGSISGFNNPTASATANTIAYRDGSGDLYARYFLGGYINTSDNVDTGTITHIMAKFGDNYHRSATAAKVQSFLGLGSLAYSSATIPTNNNQLTNGAGYITSYSETDTLGSVTNRGSSTSQNIVFSNGRKGLVGVYDAAQTQAIFAMGIDYILTNGGASSTIGNHYGLAWSYNPDYGGAGNNPQSKAGLNHQLLHMQAGITTTAIGSGIWTSGGITCGTVLPLSNNAHNLGSTGTRWANIYTNDLHLSNEGKEGGNEIDGTTGDWTIQEGEENLYIINHKNGKKFKIDLTEIV